MLQLSEYANLEWRYSVKIHKVLYILQPLSGQVRQKWTISTCSHPITTAEIYLVLCKCVLVCVDEIVSTWVPMGGVVLSLLREKIHPAKRGNLTGDICVCVWRERFYGGQFKNRYSFFCHQVFWMGGRCVILNVRMQKGVERLLVRVWMDMNSIDILVRSTIHV